MKIAESKDRKLEVSDGQVLRLEKDKSEDLRWLRNFNEGVILRIDRNSSTINDMS